MSFLAPGGTLKLMVYHRYSWKAFSVVMSYGRGAFWNLDRIIAQHSEAQEGCPVTYAYTKRQLQALIEGAGCRIQELFVDHIFPWRIPAYVQYRYEKVWHFRIVPATYFPLARNSLRLAFVRYGCKAMTVSLTLFTTCKPFEGKAARVQRNALRSWALGPACDVVVFGDEPGVREML